MDQSAAGRRTGSSGASRSRRAGRAKRSRDAHARAQTTAARPATNSGPTADHRSLVRSRAQGGAWLPQELQVRQATLRHALGQLGRQQQRLLDAYLAGVLDLETFERKRRDLAQQEAALAQQQRELTAAAQQRHALAALAAGAEEFCAQVRVGLTDATFAQRLALVELLIDRVVVTDGAVESRYAIPTSRDGPHHPFCRLRKDYRELLFCTLKQCRAIATRYDKTKRNFLAAVYLAATVIVLT